MIAGRPIDELVQMALPWVEPVARGLCGQVGAADLVDELVAEASGTVFDIARRFDPQRSNFENYAKLRLRYTMLDTLRARSKTRRRACALLASLRMMRGRSAEVPSEGGMPPSEAAFQKRFTRALSAHSVAMIFGLDAAEVEPNLGGGACCPETATRTLRLRAVLLRALEELQDAREREVIQCLYWQG